MLNIAGAETQHPMHFRCAPARSHIDADNNNTANTDAPHTDTDTKPETPIDGVREHWAPAPATGSPPCSSHASVAHTATRPSSQGPASALRFNYYYLHHPPPEHPKPIRSTTQECASSCWTQQGLGSTVA